MHHRTGNKRTPDGLLSDTNKAATIVPPIVAGAPVPVEQSAGTVVPRRKRTRTDDITARTYPRCTCREERRHV